MKKKIIVTIMTGLFLLIAGICYSCAYNKEKPDLTMTTLDGSQEETEQETPVVNSISQDAKTADMQAEDTNKMSSELKQAEDTGKQSSKLDYDDEIYAHICGAVVNPGVYKAQPGARIVDFIALTGGLRSDADGDYINQAETVEDGQRIYIPTKEEIESLDLQEYLQGYSTSEDRKGAAGSSEKETKVNLNEATAEQLMELPGIGQAKANSIVEYRKQHGKFKTTEELMNIPGIKEGLFNQISSKVTVK